MFVANHKRFSAEETPFLYHFDAPLSENELRRLKTALHLDFVDRQRFWSRPELQENQGTLGSFFEAINVRPPRKMQPYLDRCFYFIRPGCLALVEEV